MAEIAMRVAYSNWNISDGTARTSLVQNGASIRPSPGEHNGLCIPQLCVVK